MKSGECYDPLCEIHNPASAHDTACKLRNQLAAEQSKVQTLVDAIEYRVKIWLRRGGDEHWNSHMQNAYKECANELTDALAKVLMK